MTDSLPAPFVHYPFDNFDTNVVDLGGNYNATLVGYNPWNLPQSPSGVGLECATYNNRIDVPNLGTWFQGRTNFTLSFWTQGTKQNLGVPMLFVVSAPTGAQPYYIVAVNVSTTGVMSFYINDGGYRITLNHPDKLNTFHHFTMTYDGTVDGGTLKVYVDGVLTGTPLVGNTTGVATNVGSSLLSTHSTAMFGKIPWDTGSSNLTNVNIDDFRIYEETLTDAEVLNLYNSYFQQISITDQIGVQDGTSIGSVSGQQDSLIPSDSEGKSMLFTGGYIDLTTNRIADEADWTAIIIFKFTDGGAGEFPLLLLNDSAEEMRLSVYQNKIQVYANSTWDDTGIAITTDQSYFLAVSRTGTTVKFYKNGDSPVTSSNGANYSAISVKYLGADDSQTNSFVGNIDDTIIYDKVLTDQEISNLYVKTGLGV